MLLGLSPTSSRLRSLRAFVREGSAIGDFGKHAHGNGAVDSRLRVTGAPELAAPVFD